MVEPVTSQYFPRPAEGSGGGTGDTGEDDTTFDSEPGVTMGWDSWDDLPSFNDAPGGLDGAAGAGSSPTATPLNEQPLSVNPINMRSIERDMLSAAERAVEAYTSLKAKVDAAIAGGAIYGQTDTDEVYVNTTTMGGPPSGYTTDQASPIQQTAIDFAASIENYQRGALVGLANVLDVVGSYIAAVNVAGQMYAATDRSAKFPEPPAGTGS